MITCVGDDGFGYQTRENLERNGVDVSHLRMVEGAVSGVAPIFVEPDGENFILIVKGANAHLSSEDVTAAAETLAACDAILLQLEVPLDTVYAGVAFGAENGVTTILNPAPANRELDLSRLNGLDWFCPNEGELSLLSGMPTDTDAGVVKAARALIAHRIRNVIVTLGGRGARLVTASEVHVIDPVPVGPVDTTGAGDAFIGSFARFLSGGATPLDALNRAARYAAHSITGHGTQSSYADAAAFDAFWRAREV